MSLTAEIYSDFAEQVKCLADTFDPPAPVSYPDVHFTPPDSGYWLEVMVFWNESQNYGTNRTGPTVEQGFFRVVVCHRSGKGLVVSQDLAEDVLRFFSKGTRLGPALVYRMPTLSGPFQEDTRLEIPVTVWWRASR